MGMLAMVYRALQPAGYTITAVDELEWWEVAVALGADMVEKADRKTYGVDQHGNRVVVDDPSLVDDPTEIIDLDGLDLDFLLGGEEIRTALIPG